MSTYSAGAYHLRVRVNRCARTHFNRVVKAGRDTSAPLPPEVVAIRAADETTQAARAHEWRAVDAMWAEARESGAGAGTVPRERLEEVHAPCLKAAAAADRLLARWYRRTEQWAADREHLSALGYTYLDRTIASMGGE